MCCTSLLITVYALGMAFGAILTIVCMATPVWRKAYKDNTAEGYFGIFTSCISSDTVKNQCYGEWQNAPDWKKASLACLVVSLACCALAFVWSCIACCMCCCKSCLTPPLPLFAGLACALDIAGITVYGVKSGQSLSGVPHSWQELESQGDFGYSMWIGIGAIGVLFIDFLIGLVLVKTAKISPL